MGLILPYAVQLYVKEASGRSTREIEPEEVLKRIFQQSIGGFQKIWILDS